MLPNERICSDILSRFCKRIQNQPKPFQDFWERKICLETRGQSILDEEHLGQTAKTLRDYLVEYKMPNVASEPDIINILRNVRKYYDSIQPVQLGLNQMVTIKDDLEEIYHGLDGITPQKKLDGSYRSSITGESKTLMAIWGQTPGFDSVIRNKFQRWTHQPDPQKLYALRRKDVWYEPSEFYNIIKELDRWVADWPKNNNGKLFSNLWPEMPVGYIIDKIYYEK